MEYLNLPLLKKSNILKKIIPLYKEQYAVFKT